MLPKIPAANRLYLLAILLILTLGVALQVWSPTWGLLLTEWGLLFPLTLVYLRRAGLPLRQTLRLNWPGFYWAGLSLVIGLGLALFATWLTLILPYLLGYTLYLSPGLLPENIGQAVLVFLGMVISAPICEEALFRGVIQRAYEPYGATKAWLFVGLLFALFHLSPFRFFGILPVAFALGYVAWRSQSLISSILLHFSYNALVTGMLIVSGLRPEIKQDVLVSPQAAGIGLMFALAGLWLFRRRVAALPPPLEQPQELPSWWRRNWALLAALVVFCVVGSMEIIQGRYKELLVSQDFQLQPSAWQSPASWRYELLNVLDEPVGSVECNLAQQGDVYQLHCLIDQQAFEAHQGNSSYYSGDHQRKYTASWAAEDGHLVAFESAGVENYDRQVIVQSSGEGMLLQVSESQALLGEMDFPRDALLEDEWPWRLMAMDFQAGSIYRVKFVWPLRWLGEIEKSVPHSEDVFVSILGVEPLVTPAGNFVAWRITVGDLTAWYDTLPPHTLLCYDNGMVRFMLLEKP